MRARTACHWLRSVDASFRRPPPLSRRTSPHVEGCVRTTVHPSRSHSHPNAGLCTRNDSTLHGQLRSSVFYPHGPALSAALRTFHFIINIFFCFLSQWLASWSSSVPHYYYYYYFRVALRSYIKHPYGASTRGGQVEPFRLVQFCK